MENRNSAPASHDPRRFGVVSVAGRRPANEDAWAGPTAAADSVACYIVADGVGGQERGAQAAQTAAAAVARAFDARRAAGDDPPTALRAAVALANEEVYRLARSLGVERMGCTLVAAAVGGGRLDVAHVGDARAWLLRDGQLYRLTRDHTWVQEQMDRGTIAPADAARHELRHIVTRVLGNDPTIEVALSRPAAFGPGDRLLLSSDGLHDVIDEARLGQLLGAAPPPDAARALVEAALAAGSEDNVTALVVASAAVGGAPGARPPEARIAAAPPPEAITVQGQRRPADRRPPEARPMAPPTPVSPRRRTAAGPALIGALALLLIFGAGAILLRNIRATGVPESAPAAAIPVVAATVAPAAEASSLPRATSTAAPIAGAGDPLPAATDAAYPAPGLPPAGAARCAILPDRIVYMWSDRQAEGDDVCENPERELTDDQVWLLSPSGEMRRMSAVWRWNICYQADFVRVQSVAAPNQVGWILAEHLAECQ